MTELALLEPDQDVLKNRKALMRRLKKVAPLARFVEDEEGLRAYETDALTAYRQVPMGVLLPTTTQEVSDILKFCHENNIKVIARGAGTSLSGGALPDEDSIVLSVARMNQVLELDFENRTARVQAGITNLAISNAAGIKGFFYAPDPSSQIACTLAGNIAMNSGGAHCLKYGVTANNLLGVKIVMMDGEIIEIGGKYLDSPGYDLLGLITGSEGQLGVVTEATVRLLRKSEGARPMLIGFRAISSAGACVAAIIGAGIIPVALEFMDRPAIHVCENFAKAGYPLDVEALLIVELEGSDDEIDALMDRVAQIASTYHPKIIRVAQSQKEADAIWKGRKAAFGAMGQISDYYCMDGTIPLSRLPEVLGRVSYICDYFDLDVANIFHAGDGNLHPLILYDANDPEQLKKAETCGAEILKVCVEMGGCLTGEHGVGVEKRELMTVQYTPTDLYQQMRIKSAFDPKWLLNPAKVFPLDLRKS